MTLQDLSQNETAGAAATVLALDSATRVCSAAVAVENTLLAEQYLAGQKNHSGSLLVLVDGVLSTAGIRAEELSYIAVTIGPGSFTGLRVGISAAQGLACGLGKQLVGVSTLDVLAAQGGGFSGWVCPMIDAGKKQVYAARYHGGEGRCMRRHSEAVVLAPEAFLADVTGPALFIGSGALLYRDVIRQADPAGLFEVGAGPQMHPRAATVALLAVEAYADSGGSAPEMIRACYVRAP
ncbi:MAG: tRNA (adenosine(37)-N6)-threonylcarbamoyltransferase complex dimerization subunit type 1 TsaB, partial [Deltaproteobacteria bacterium]|nr:tRNA (adenosine(37)-N6)-threonylcarbamoyltransferase complex dimerization subunit type 1 TsaB [Deltaproteobacteria bacterium]